VLTLPDLPAGVYSVNWRVLSEADGHATRGVMVFGVGSGADVSTAVTATTRVTLPPEEVSLRWLNFSILAALWGALGMAALVLKPKNVQLSIQNSIAQARSRVIAWAGIATVLAFGTGLGLLFWQANVLQESLPAGVSLPTVVEQILTHTRWGALWVIRQGMLLVMGIIIPMLYRSTLIGRDNVKTAASSKILLLISIILPYPLG
jgi:hypothetical protein